VLAALGPMGFCLAIVAFMPNIWTITLIVLAFFFAYYVYEPPYRGLYPDILHESLYGRSQGVQHVLRGIALGVALVAGGFLFKVWHPAPFLLAAVATTAACGAVVLYVREPEGEGSRVFRGVRSYVKTSWTVFFEVPEVRRFLFANAAWEGTFAAMRTFVVLYITIGLGQPLSTSSAVLALVQMGMCTLLFSAGGTWSLRSPNASVWFAIIITGLFASAFGYYVQTWAQAHISANRTALILATEPAWALVAAIALAGQRFGWVEAAGAAVLLLAIVGHEVASLRFERHGQPSPP